MKTTIEMAKEAFASRGAVDAWFKDATPNFEAFAKMIRDEEREACAALCETEICACCWKDGAQEAAEYLADKIRGRK